VQLVLNYEIGRRQRRREPRALARLRSTIEPRTVVPLCTTQESSGLAYPWKGSELINRRNQESGETTIKGFINCQDGKRSIARKVTFEVSADNAQLTGLVVIRQEHKRI